MCRCCCVQDRSHNAKMLIFRSVCPLYSLGVKPATAENPRIDLFSPMTKEPASRTNSMASADSRPSLSTRSRGNSKLSTGSDAPRELLPERPSQAAPCASPLLTTENLNGEYRFVATMLTFFSGTIAKSIFFFRHARLGRFQN